MIYARDIVLLIAFSFVMPCLFVWVGFAIHKHRSRLGTAWKILRGHIALSTKDSPQPFSCGRTHVEANQVAVDKPTYDGLVRAKNELILAQGFIAHADLKKVYPDAVASVIDKQQ